MVKDNRVEDQADQAEEQADQAEEQANQAEAHGWAVTRVQLEGINTQHTFDRKRVNTESR
jgi:hypothetical protein